MDLKGLVFRKPGLQCDISLGCISVRVAMGPLGNSLAFLRIEFRLAVMAFGREKKRKFIVTV